MKIGIMQDGKMQSLINNIFKTGKINWNECQSDVLGGVEYRALLMSLMPTRIALYARGFLLYFILIEMKVCQ